MMMNAASTSASLSMASLRFRRLKVRSALAKLKIEKMNLGVDKTS